MRENITKVAERGERLDALQDKTGAFSLVFVELGDFANASACTDNLAQSAQGFRKGANRVRKQMVRLAAWRRRRHSRPSRTSLTRFFSLCSGGTLDLRYLGAVPGPLQLPCEPKADLWCRLGDLASQEGHEDAHLDCRRYRRSRHHHCR